jgi:hypothetical protein
VSEHKSEHMSERIYRCWVDIWQAMIWQNVSLDSAARNMLTSQRRLHVWGQMEAIDWPCHALIFDPRVKMKSKKHKCNLRAVIWIEEAQKRCGSPTWQNDPNPFTPPINRGLIKPFRCSFSR